MPGDAFPSSVDRADAQGIQVVRVEYDETNDSVTVTPQAIEKGTTVRFKNPSGGLRIAFLSPSGEEMEPLSDTELFKLAIGGTYHFRCFFTPVGKNGEISPENGGVIDVLPLRP